MGKKQKIGPTYTKKEEEDYVYDTRLSTEK
jgi:hypothetical protein